MEHFYAQVNGVRLHCVSEGLSEGRPLILFLHGFPEFWYAWKDQLREFGRDYFAVAPDMRGYNLSDKPAEAADYQMKHLVADVRALAIHLGYRKFTLVGHDWGGAVAWAYAIAHPETLDRLVIVNAPHPAVFARELAQNPAQQRASQYMLAFRTPRAEAMLASDNYAALIGIVMGDGLRTGVFTEADRLAYIAAWSQPGALTGGLNYYRAARIGPPAAGSAGGENLAVDPTKLSVQVPTLVIWGERDSALLTGNLDGLERFVPNLTVRRIPDGSHWVIHERPEPVNAAIQEFAKLVS